MPVVGHSLMVFLRGGEDVTGTTLTRFFGFHVAVLPGLATLFVLAHLALVQYFGMSVPPGVEARWNASPAEARQMKFFPNFILRELMAWYIALGVLGALAAILPWGLGTKADPFAPAPAGIRPELYFMFLFQTLKKIPANVWFVDGEVAGFLVFGGAGLVWTLLPFFDQASHGRGRKWIMGAGVFALSYIIAMTIYGYMAK